MKTWDDQPDIVTQGAKLLEFSYEGRIYEIRKLSHQLLTNKTRWFVTGGTLFQSQTLEVPTLEKAVLLVNYSVHLPKSQRPAKLDFLKQEFGAEVVA